MLELIKIGIKSDYFSLNMLNIIYLGQSVIVQCLKHRGTCQISDIHLDLELANCENVPFRQFIESVMSLMYLSFEI